MPKSHDPMNWNHALLPKKSGENHSGTSLAELQEEMNRLFNHFYNGSPAYMSDWDEKMPTAPAVNIMENGNSFRIEAELAGIDPKTVDVEVANGFLTLKGERKEDDKKEGENYLRHEISYGSFVRTVALPESVDGDQAKASFKNGILIVTIPKKPEAQQKPKKIEIKAST